MHNVRPRLDLAERNLRTLHAHAVRAGLHTVPVYPQDVADLLAELDRLRHETASLQIPTVAMAIERHKARVAGR